ncbi:MAG: GFA family protein [Arenicellales bacterium]
MNKTPLYQGQCLCGKITYAFKKFHGPIGHCHCKMCQRFSGSAFATYACVLKSDFHWESGEHLLSAYVAENDTTRQFCKQCGAGLTFASTHGPDEIEIALGTLNQPLAKGLAVPMPDAHIYLDSKAYWFTPNDNLTCYAAYRDGEPL